MKRDGKRSIKGIREWFEKNPEKNECKVEFFYGKMIPVRRDHVAEDVNKVVDDQIAEQKLRSAARIKHKKEMKRKKS
jgi:hypothetical protein